MIILTLRTDKPEAEISLYKGHQQLRHFTWQAHRELSDTVHLKIREILEIEQKTWQDLEGIIFYKGPGSFTGLRIGATIANALGASLNIPSVTTGSQVWIEAGLQRLLSGENDRVVIPDYGGPAKTTLPRK